MSHSAPSALGPACLRCHPVLHSAPVAQKNKKRRCQGDGDGTLFRGRDVRLVGPRKQPIAFGRVGGWWGGLRSCYFWGAGRGVTQQSAAKSERTHSISGGRLCVCVCEREIHFGSCPVGGDMTFTSTGLVKCTQKAPTLTLPFTM